MTVSDIGHFSRETMSFQMHGHFPILKIYLLADLVDLEIVSHP